MALARPLVSLLSLIFLAGGILLSFLVILSGTGEGNPVNRVYFLQAATNGITGARNPSRWTYFAVCGVAGDRNSNCGAVVPALPFDPPNRRNFGTTTGVPPQFIGTNMYYYLSRFAWVFFLIALFFAACALLTGLLALCTRVGAYLSGLNALMAVFFQALACALMTAWTVKARNVFRSNGVDANLGKWAYGLTWAAMACWFLAAVLFCVGGSVSKDRSSRKSKVGRSRSTRSRGSFIDSESQRRVKDEYE